jgi:hypothetical protein
MAAGQTGSAQIRIGGGAFADLSPPPTGTNWTTYTIPVSSNVNVPAMIAGTNGGIYMQNKNTPSAVTYYVSSFKFVFEVSECGVCSICNFT